MQPTYAIEVTGLYKSFGSQAVLQGVDVKVPAGQVYALLGPNGAGKTTFIHILSTLVKPDRGSIRIAGHDLASDKKAIKQAISLTGQFAAVDEVLTGTENLMMMGRLLGLSAQAAKERAQELIERFDLANAAQKRVKTYSGGMRRKLDLAISLIVPKPVLFLDEPTTGLDTHSRRALWDIILQLAEQGMTIFLTTQYLEEADQLADQIAVIDGGKIIASGTPAELKSRVGGEVVELRNALDEVIHTIPTTGEMADVQRILEEISGSLPANTRIHVRRPSIDDVFVALTTSKTMEGSVK